MACDKPFNTPQSTGACYEREVPDTLDLAERAELGLQHFLDIIREEPQYDYEMPFRVGYWRPPVLRMHVSSLPCCQPKALEAMAYLRLMTGSTEKLEVEANMIEMMVSMLGADGLYWAPGADAGGKEWLEIPEPFVYLHGQGRMLRAMIAWYQYTGDSAWKTRIDKLAGGLDALAVHQSDYAFFPTAGRYGREYQSSCYTKDGWKNLSEPADEKKSGEEGSVFNHQGNIPGALATWYTLTGNEQALRLSGQLVRFLTKPKFWADWEASECPGVVGAEHAHWWGHFHGHVNTLRAILEYALAANNAKLKEFVRDGYQWMRQKGFAAGGFFDPQGCGTGRALGLAVKLTEAGIGDYWEDIDQCIRNYGVEAQVVPEDMDYILDRAEKAGVVTDDIRCELYKMIGGFNHIPAKPETLLCCSPHGSMGLFYAWDGALRCDDGAAQVNLLLNRASPCMDVDSYLPYEGKVVISNKTAREARIRIPLWADVKSVNASVNRQPVHQQWFGRYLRITDLKPGDSMTITFPMVERTERWTIPDVGGYPEREVAMLASRCRFKGNTLVEMAPKPESWAGVFNHRGKYLADKAPMKTAVRYIYPRRVIW